MLLGLPSERIVRVFAGDLVGRLPTAVARVDDPRVSEAHAMASLRGERFWLLGLRGSLRTGRRWTHDVELADGLLVELAPEVAIEVLAVELPERISVLVSDPGAWVLERAEWSLGPDGATSGTRRDAHAWLWSSGEGWRLGGPARPVTAVAPGDSFDVAGRRWCIETQPVHAAGHSPTLTDQQWQLPPMTIDVFEARTELSVEGRDRGTLRGNPHRLIRATLQVTQGKTDAHWPDIAARIWPANATETNWFTNLRRLRERLREMRLPPDILTCRAGRASLIVRADVDRIVLHDAHLR